MFRHRYFAEVPKRLKGHPWKGCRSLIAARGFKSLLLRFILKKMKKLLTKQRRCDKILNVAAENSNNMNLENERLNSV